jgi:hypoxanthine phosphoribosyltransferase
MPDVQQAWKFLDDSEPVASAAEVASAVQRLAGEIAQRFTDAYPLVLAVMGGAVVFAGQILPRLRFPLDFDYIHASRYGSATRGSRIEWRVTPPEGVKERAVLVLDDILDGGETMAAIRERLLGLGARSFHCAVLVEKKLKVEKPSRRISSACRSPTASSSAAAWTRRASGATCRRSAR